MFRREVVKHGAARKSILARFKSNNSIEAEVELLQRLLTAAKQRLSTSKFEVEPLGPRLQIGTINQISQKGLAQFPPVRYETFALADHPDRQTHAILLRGHQLHPSEVKDSVRAVARCGVTVDNIPVEELTRRGIPVFHTPGANANAVKELVMGSLFLASRNMLEGMQHANVLLQSARSADEVAAQVEKDKKMFTGRELAGKTLGVVGLGNIGAAVANAAYNLNMRVICYDPALSVDTALRLPSSVEREMTLEALLARSDYVTLHASCSPQTHNLLNSSLLNHMKPTASLFNFAHGSMVDTKALRDRIEKGFFKGKYIADFPDQLLANNPHAVFLPHLGSATEEAETNAAEVAAKCIIDYLESGSISNSINFPSAKLNRLDGFNGARLCIVNENLPGVLGRVTTAVGTQGLNIVQTINTSRGAVAYNVIDIDGIPEDSAVADLQETLGKLEGVVSTRLIDPSYRAGFFWVNGKHV